MARTITAAQNARDEAHLSKLVRRHDGRILTRRDNIREHLEAGYTLGTFTEPDYDARERYAEKARRMNSGSDWVPTGNPNHPRTIEYRRIQALADSAVKTYDVLQSPDDSGFVVLSATEKRYAESLL